MPISLRNTFLINSSIYCRIHLHLSKTEEVSSLSRKTVLIVGGIHQVGKSTLCKYLAERRGALVLRQRHFLVECGKEMDLEWEEVGRLHYELIEQVAARIQERILSASNNLAVIDCHYAIRTSKALRANGLDIRSPYIPDLDPIVVRDLLSVSQVYTMMISTAPEVCVARLGERGLGEDEFTIEGMKTEAVAEADFFGSLVCHFSEELMGAAVIQNERRLSDLYKEVDCFIKV